MATISPSGNGSNDGDRNHREQRKIGPLPPEVKKALKKKRRLTDLSRDPMNAKDYAEILGDVIRSKREEEQQQRSEESAEARERAAILANLEEIWQGLLRMIRVRNDVLDSIAVILCFIDINTEDMANVPVEQLRACLLRLKEYVEKKNEEDDAHQKKITDYFNAEE